ncbi:hypothetical protein O1611_g3033 [Lasiodiplodia mahajangana]|uniref:Uncharacterized protein n=1 Tax=Lasiodiplodia mahajangana TaxID=1108764 RepID=A0ACC2JSX3_9PEZI|nr:hypothetical protein O1611_g3033 [Lasiodiplodia mahajangana]
MPLSNSDILGRHTAIHNPRERRNDNPQRRRACHECARVRERCSRGDPCRRCASKALHCLYPDEPSSKIALPNTTWNSSKSEQSDYAATTANMFDPQSPLAAHYTGGDAPLHVQGGSQWQIEDSSMSYGGSSMPSLLPQKGFQPYQPSHHGTPIAPFPSYDALSPSDEGLYQTSLGDDSTAHMKFMTSDAGPEAVLETYHQTPNISSKLPSGLGQMGLHQTNPSVEFQGHYISRELPDTRQLGVPFAPHHNSSSVSHTILNQPEMLNPSIVLGGYDDMSGSQASSAAFNGHEILAQPLQAPYPRPVDLKVYDFTTTPFDEHFQESRPPV